MNDDTNYDVTFTGDAIKERTENIHAMEILAFAQRYCKAQKFDIVIDEACPTILEHGTIHLDETIDQCLSSTGSFYALDKATLLPKPPLAYWPNDQTKEFQKIGNQMRQITRYTDGKSIGTHGELIAQWKKVPKPKQFEKRSAGRRFGNGKYETVLMIALFIALF